MQRITPTKIQTDQIKRHVVDQNVNVFICLARFFFFILLSIQFWHFLWLPAVRLSAQQSAQYESKTFGSGFYLQVNGYDVTARLQMHVLVELSLSPTHINAFVRN